MADKGPNYSVQRRKLMLQNLEHRDTIEKGEARLAEIERMKAINLQRVEIQNLDLEDEAQRIRENRDALEAKIAENEGNLDKMVKEPRDG